MVFYLRINFSNEELTSQLTNPDFKYRLLLYKNQRMGYFKLNINTTNQCFEANNVTKMERLFSAEYFFDLGL